MIGFDSLRSARPQPSSRFMHRKPETMKQARDVYTDIHVETQMWEKPRQSTNCRIHYGRGVQQRGYTEATTSCPLLRHTRWLQLRQRPHTHTLSLSRCLYTHALYNYFTKVQQLLYTHTLKVSPKSYLYIYDFWVIYTCSLPIGRVQSVGSDRYRVFSHPVLPNFHPEGPVSQQEGGAKQNTSSTCGFRFG